MSEPTTPAGRWLVDHSQWDDGLRAFRVRINVTAGPEDMLIHVLAIEREERERIVAKITEMMKNGEWDTTYSAEPGVSVKKLLRWLRP